jgi:hypothetical protein
MRRRANGRSDNTPPCPASASTHARYLCKGDYDDGGQYCIGFGGSSADRCVGQALLKAIAPFGQLRLDDIEWETGSLRVSGKSRYEVRLPLPQDVGDAIAAYPACHPSTCPSDHVFLAKRCR